MPDGGTIILGLDESLGFVPTGLADLATLEAGVASQARTAVSPSVQCDFTTVEYREESILVCEVAGLPLQSRPARHGHKAYLRQSDGDYVMSEQEVAQIELQKTQALRRSHPDREGMQGVTTDDLDEDLLAGQPSLSITAAVQLPRGSTSRTRDLVHLDGPLPELLDQAMEWVSRNTRTSIAYDPRGHGVDRAELPMKAVREIIANALVHRSLDSVTDAKRVEIRLMDDRLVITSPGGLWGVSEQQLGQPEGKSAVNVWLYDMCKMLRMPDGRRVIEGEGGGIREAIVALREAGLQPPVFVDSGVRFTAVLSRHTLLEDEDLKWLAALPHIDELASEQRAVLASMRHGEVWTNSRVRDEFAPLDSVEARRLLQHLVELGLAQMSGSRGTATYRLVGRLPTAPAVTQEQLSFTGDQGSPQAVPEQVRSVSKYAEAVWSELSQPQSLSDLVAALGLTARQVRYALRRMREADLITMQGKQGERDVTYRRAQDGS